MQAVLASHEGGDGEDGALVAEDGFADARDAGGDGEAGVALEVGYNGSRRANGDKQFFMTGERFCTRVLSEGKAGDLGGAPDGDGGIAVFADDSGVNGARVNFELLAEKLA